MNLLNFSIIIFVFISIVIIFGSVYWRCDDVLE